jgi:nucleoid DNA-binding protein
MVDWLFGLIKDTLADGEDLLISEFGTFLIRQKMSGVGGTSKPRKL